MAKRVVFMTGEKIGANVSEAIHLYRRMASFKKSGDVSIITQDFSGYPEQAGCKKVLHLNADESIADAAILVAKQADMFVVVGISPNVDPFTNLLGETKPGCCIAIINKGCLELPEELHHKNVVRMRDMSIGTGLTFLSVYWYLKNMVEE